MSAEKEARRTSWLVFGSLLVGVALALLLVLGVFVGGTEARIAGGALLGFAGGWLALAVTTTRWANPQRWAFVPAAVMAVVGGLLVLANPGPVAMDRLNWVWPPVAMATVIWVFVRARSGMSGIGRVLTLTVVGMLGLASVGAYYENIAAAMDRREVKAPGHMYSVSGHDLHLWCVGAGSPTVVLENGLGEVSASWGRVMAYIGSGTRVCAHDRAGQGWSESAGSPKDAVASATDLRALLAKAGEKGPFVLAGHSTGGTFAMVYAAQYPEDVAGMVLLDSSSPHQFDLPDYPSQYPMLQRLYSVFPSLSHIGIRRLVAGHSSTLPGSAGRQVDANVNARNASGARDEVSVLRRVFDQAGDLTTLGDRPLAVVSASASLKNTKGWDEAQADMTHLSSNARSVVAQSSHEGLLGDADGAKVSIAAITDVLQAVRTNSVLVSE